MTWVAVAVSVGTALVGAYEQKQVANKQDRALADQLRQQYATEDKVHQRTQKFIQGQQQQTDQPQKTEAAQQYQQAVKANQAMASAPVASAGNVSDAYKKASQDAALGVASYAKNRGDTIASIDAPTLQRQQNQRNVADFGIDVNQINRHQKSQDFLDQLRLNSIHANPWVGLLTNIAGGVAKAKFGGSGGGGSGGGFDAGGVSDSGGTFDVSNPGGIYG